MEITNHSRSERRRSSSLADNKESQKSARLLSQDHSSTMLNNNSIRDRPKTAYSVSPGKCIHQKLPSREDLERYSSGFKRWKMGAPGSSDNATISRQNTSKRMTILDRSKKGLNTGNSWFDNDRRISLVEEKTVDRFMSTPYYDTMIRCFPTFNMRAISVPKAHKHRSRDVTPQFANFSVSSQNAFKTAHLKEKYSEAVKVYPNKHPEFCPTDTDFNFKIDRMKNYVESMLKLKPLWDPNKLRQTKLAFKN
jgi:hypothetical protein